MFGSKQLLLFRSPDGEVMPYEEMPKDFVRRNGDGSRVYVNPEFDVGESMTNQSEAPQADINWIVRRYHNGEALPVIDGGQFIDVSEIESYEQVVDRIAEFSNVFSQFPAEVRERFKNRAELFADFVVDPANFDEGVRLGIFKAAEVPPAGGAPPAEGGGAPPPV